MIGIGKVAPAFRLPGVLGGKKRDYSLSDFRNQWVVLFFYPADFTFICPTEVLGFHKRFLDFQESGAAILGVSVDSIDSHVRWAEELRGLSYPLLSDPTKEVCRQYFVLEETEGVAQRATFIIDPQGKIVYEVGSSMNVGRSVEETYRVLKAQQSGRMCPADWKPGQETADPSLKY